MQPSTVVDGQLLLAPEGVQSKRKAETGKIISQQEGGGIGVEAVGTFHMRQLAF